MPHVKMSYVKKGKWAKYKPWVGSGYEILDISPDAYNAACGFTGTSHEEVTSDVAKVSCKTCLAEISKAVDSEGYLIGCNMDEYDPPPEMRASYAAR